MRNCADMNVEIHICEKQAIRESRWGKRCDLRSACSEITSSRRCEARPDSDISQPRHTKMRIYADMNVEIHICEKQAFRESRGEKRCDLLSVCSEITPSWRCGARSDSDIGQPRHTKT